MHREDDFSITVKTNLAKRAGYFCSIPGCNKLTIGPGKGSNDIVVNIGVAAHICAASKGGPRFDAKMTLQQRRSISNAIWFCANHGRLIDRDSPDTYSAELLKKWKSYHEQRIHFSQSGIPLQMSFFSKVTVSNLASISSPLTIELDKTTVLFGNTGTGKTLFCEIIAALSDNRYLERWIKKRNPGLSVIDIEFFAIEPKTFKTTIQDGNVHFFIDEVPTISLRPACHVQYLSERFLYDSGIEESFLQQYARYFGLSQYEVTLVLNHINCRGGGLLVSEISVRNDAVTAKIMPKDHSLAYLQLSAGEQQLVNLDIALNLAKFHSQLRPTILILEQSAFPTLDKDNLEKLLKTLCDKSWPFQTIVTFHKFNQELARQNMSVWQLRLVGKEIEARKLCHN